MRNPKKRKKREKKKVRLFEVFLPSPRPLYFCKKTHLQPKRDELQATEDGSGTGEAEGMRREGGW